MTTKPIKCEEVEETESKKTPEIYNDLWVASKVFTTATTPLPLPEQSASCLILSIQPIKCEVGEETESKKTPEINNDIWHAPKAFTTATTPSPSPEQSASCLIQSEETPHIRQLKIKINVLQEKNILNTQRIRRLQKVIWRQKRQISSLKANILELKKTNVE